MKKINIDNVIEELKKQIILIYDENQDVCKFLQHIVGKNVFKPSSKRKIESTLFANEFELVAKYTALKHYSEGEEKILEMGKEIFNSKYGSETLVHNIYLQMCQIHKKNKQQNNFELRK